MLLLLLLLLVVVVVVVVEGRTCKNLIYIRFCLLSVEPTVTSLPRTSTVEIYKVSLRSSTALHLCLSLIKLLLQKKEVSEFCPYMHVCVHVYIYICVCVCVKKVI